MIVIPVLFQDIDGIDYEKMGLDRPENVESFEKNMIFFSIDNIHDSTTDNDEKITILRSGGEEYTSLMPVEQILQLIAKSKEA